MVFNPHDQEWLKRKFDVYKELRTRSSAYYSEEYNSYIITKYEDVLFALKNPDIFSSAKGNLVTENPNRFNRTLGASDNPKHNFFKNIVKDAYSKENIDRIVFSIKNWLRQELSEKSEINASALADTVTAMITAEILNLPVEKKKIVELIIDIQHKSSRAVAKDQDDTSYDEFVKILEDLNKSRIPATGPGIYHEYVTYTPIDMFIPSLFIGPIISGASSMTSALQFLTLDLYRENKIDNIALERDMIPYAVTESLRFHASTGRFSRTVTEECFLHGINLKPNDRVILCLDSANRDPEEFNKPDQFILSRNTVGLAFGYGVHACIALSISKSVMEVYLESLIDVFGRYKVLTSNRDLKYLISASGNNDMILNINISNEH